MKTETINNIKNLNIENIVKSIFPYSKDFEVKLSIFTELGIAEWATWFIVIYRGNILDDYLLLQICGHSDYTKTNFLIADFDIIKFENELKKAIDKNDVFQFVYFNKQIGDLHFLNINEMKRLYDFLFESKIILFEPTE